MNEKEQLLTEIKNHVSEAIEGKGYANTEAVKGLVAEALKAYEGLDIEALKALKPVEITETLQKQAAMLDKLNERAEKQAGVTIDFKSVLEKKMPDIEKVMSTKQGFVTLDVKAAAVMTTSNTTIEPNDLPDDIIESMTMREFVGKRYGRQFIGDIADRTTVSNMEQYTTWLEEGSEQGAFAIVAEGALKPLVSYDLVRNFTEARKIAGKYVVTEEFTKFRRRAYDIIRRLIMDKMMRDYDAILTADLNTAAAAYTGTVLDGTITNPTDFDAIGAVAAQIESLNFAPDVLIINTQDKWRLALSKDTTGQYYLFLPQTDPNGVTRLMGFRVVTSTYQTAGYFTLGESGLFKIEEEAITVRIGYGIQVTSSGGNVTAVESDFDHNRFRVIVETYFKDWLATPHIGSFVRAQFSTVKEALDASV